MTANNNQPKKTRRISNFLRVPVVTKDGEKLSETVYRNTVFPALQPEFKQNEDLKQDAGDYPLILVQWGEYADGGEYEVTSDMMENPVKFGDHFYIANRYAGTNVKEKRTLGVRVDVVPFFQRFLENAEMATKINRCAIPMGMGAWVAESLSVQYAADGQVIGNLCVEDGIAYAAEDLFDDYNGSTVKYEWGRQNLQVWQDLDPTLELMAAAEEIAADYYSVVNSRVPVYRELVEKSDIYEELLQANPMMGRHPYVVKRVANTHAMWFLERLSTLPIMMRIGVAAPVPRHIRYLPDVMEPGIYIDHRYPKTGPSGTYVHRVTEITDEMRFWHGWIKARWGFQFTLTNRKESWKGVIVAVPRSEMPRGVDILTSASNVKLGPNRRKTIKNRVKRDGNYHYTIDEETVIVATQVYRQGSFSGVNMTKYDENGLLVPWSWPAKNGDCDGDHKFWAKVNEAIAKAIEDSQIPEALTIKSNKTESNRNKVPRMLANAFLGGQLIGVWTNMRAWYLALDAERRKQVQIRLYEDHLLRPELCEPTHRAVIYMFGSEIQDCVDSPKNMKGDMWESRRKAGEVQGVLLSVSTKSPGFTHWKRSEGAGRRYLPGFTGQLPEWALIRASVDKDFRQEDIYKDSIPDDMETGIIARFVKMNRPYIEQIWEDSVSIDVLPLSEYAGWAGVVKRAEIDKAEEFFFPKWKEYNARKNRDQLAGRYDPSDYQEVFQKHQEWEGECELITKAHFGGDRMRAARALWVAAHQSHRIRDDRNFATAAIVFIGFRAECLKIVSGAETEHGGTIKTVAIGLKHHFAGKPPLKFVANVRVVERKDRPGKKAIVALEQVANLLKGGDDGFPARTIGVVAPIERHMIRSGFMVPDFGDYHATFESEDGAKWAVNLTAI